MYSVNTNIILYIGNYLLLDQPTVCMYYVACTDGAALNY